MCWAKPEYQPATRDRIVPKSGTTFQHNLPNHLANFLGTISCAKHAAKEFETKRSSAKES